MGDPTRGSHPRSASTMARSLVGDSGSACPLRRRERAIHVRAPCTGGTRWVARRPTSPASTSWPTTSGWLPKDVVAGLVLTALLVPQGMAYAELAGLPPVTGLYTSILCLLGYAVFGPSRVLVLGPDSSLGPMVAATIAPLVLAGGDPARAVALASVLALLVGFFMVLAGSSGSASSRTCSRSRPRSAT